MSVGLRWPLLLLLHPLVAHSDTTGAGQAPQTITRDAVINAALESDHAVAASFEAEALGHLSGVAGVLPDPSLSLMVAPMSLLPDGAAPGIGLGVTQAITWPASREAARDSAEQREAAARSATTEASHRGALQGALLHDRLFLAERSLETIEAHRLSLEHLREGATAAASQGLQGTSSLVHLETLLSRLSLRELSLEGEVAALREELALWTGRAAGSLRTDPETPLPSPPLAAESEHPLVERDRALLEAARAARRGAEVAKLPRPMVGLAWTNMRMFEEHHLTASVGLTAPLPSTAAARERAAESREAAALSRLEWREEQSAIRVAASRERLAAHLATVEEISERLLPSANLRVESLTAAFAAGHSTLLEVVTAIRDEIEAELALHRAVASALSADATLREALGLSPLSSASAGAAAPHGADR